MIELRPYQNEAIDEVRRRIAAGKRRILFVLPTGGGKCLAIGTTVLMFDGRVVPVETVVVGDRLMGPDSTPRTVLATTRARGPMYRITPTKGRPWECNDVHVLTLVDTVTHKITDIDLQSYLAQTKTFKHRNKLFVTGADFPPGEPLRIDPYFMGVWFGDGTKRLNGVSITKPDAEILALVHSVAREHGLLVRTYTDPRSGCPTHHIHGVQGAGNPFLTKMRSVVTDSTTIPHEYLVASRSDREQFLAGMIDTDGYNHHGGIEIVQKYEGIARGVAFIARSLGLRVSACVKRVSGAPYFRMSISGDMSKLPIRIERKRPTPRLQIKDARRTGFKVEPIGDGEYAGFELDGDGRFLLGDFTVTHNTVVAAAIIKSAVARGSRVVFCVHRREILAQTARKLIQMGVPEESIGVMMADGKISLEVGGPLTDFRRPRAQVQLCSIDTLRNRKLPEGRLIFIDECHRALSPSYKKFSDAYPNAVHLGLTATPYLASGRGMIEAYEDIVTVASVRQLIDLGFLVEPVAFTVNAANMPDLSGVSTRAGDYEIGELEEIMDRKQLVGSIVGHWQRRAEGRRTVVFATSVAHSQHIVAEFVAAGIIAEHLDGTTERGARDAMLARLDRGETQVVSNCGVLAEGWDCPSVKCLVLARPTKSKGLYLQQAGRILRPWNDVGALILDHAANVVAFGLPQSEQEFTLEARKKKSKNVDVPAKTCPSCLAIVATATRECVCGHEFGIETMPRPMPEQADGELVEIVDTPLEVQKAYFDEQAAIAVARGYKPGFAFARFLERFGHKPPRSVQGRKPLLKFVTYDEEFGYWQTLLAKQATSGYKRGWAFAQFKARTGKEPPRRSTMTESERLEWAM